MSEKTSIRKKFLNIRAQMTQESRDRLAVDAAKNFLSLLSVEKVRVLAAYVAIDNEIDPLPLVAVARDKGVRIALPVIVGKDDAMVFKLWNDGDGLVPGHLHDHILQPASSAEIILPDVILTPAIAFDLRGYRVGYGGGYYDRTFDYLESIGHSFKSVGYGYSNQLIDQLPIERHDHKLDFIVTEKHILAS